MSYQPLTDSQWDEISWLLPVQEIGRPRKRDREMMDAILYVLILGCAWEDLPQEFPPKSTVYDRFCSWSKAGFFQKAFKRLRHFLPDSDVYHLDASAKAAKKGGG